MAKWVYLFKEGNASMRNLLGGKGCNLAEMTGLGMPIPQGFTVTTEACTDYYAKGKQISDEIKDQIFTALNCLRASIIPHDECPRKTRNEFFLRYPCSIFILGSSFLR